MLTSLFAHPIVATLRNQQGQDLCAHSRTRSPGRVTGGGCRRVCSSELVPHSPRPGALPAASGRPQLGWLVPASYLPPPCTTGPSSGIHSAQERSGNCERFAGHSLTSPRGRSGGVSGRGPDPGAAESGPHAAELFRQTPVVETCRCHPRRL